FGGYIFPLIILCIGILFLLDKININGEKKALYLSIIFICFLVILDIYTNNRIGFLNRINFSLKASEKGYGGGIIGSILGFTFLKLFGDIGSYIIISFLILINIIMITEIKINNLIKRKVKKKSSKSIVVNDNTKKAKFNNKPENKNIKIFNYKNNEEKNRKTVENKLIKNTKSTKNYKMPLLEMLDDVKTKGNANNKKEVLLNARKIEDTMESFGIKTQVVQINKGPTITCYELEPAPGVKVSKIVNLSNDISLNLATSDVRIEAPIPGKSVVGIEVPNRIKSKVNLKGILTSDEFKYSESKVPIALGKNISGKPIVTSIDKMPHLLIAGATGSGKSVCINSIIMSILFKSTPEEVKMLLIDPKVVELSIYNGIPHLLVPVVTDAKKANAALDWAVDEMEKRYKLFSKNNVRDIDSYNKRIKGTKKEKLPQIVIIIDELADLMMVSAQEIEDYICRLAQMARAAGIYLIIATQRPSVDVITGTIKANIPSRISFAVTSQTDSRTILDIGGAEKLLGKGDMLFYPSNLPKPIRVQGAFVKDEEVYKVTEFLKSQNVSNYKEEIIETLEKNVKVPRGNGDELLPDAINLVVEEGQASISLLQRRLRIGYARAARLIDEMEEREIVGGFEGSKPRKVLITKEDLDS
ncbi:MAG TPA: DNA translocase FtsK, partial [Tissierellales bacterium]|nr:DNA translocase FtsK [Tissierellales bacterium]